MRIFCLAMSCAVAGPLVVNSATHFRSGNGASWFSENRNALHVDECLCRSGRATGLSSGVGGNSGILWWVRPARQINCGRSLSRSVLETYFPPFRARISHHQDRCARRNAKAILQGLLVREQFVVHLPELFLLSGRFRGFGCPQGMRMGPNSWGYLASSWSTRALSSFSTRLFSLSDRVTAAKLRRKSSCAIA